MFVFARVDNCWQKVEVTGLEVRLARSPHRCCESKVGCALIAYVKLLDTGRSPYQEYVVVLLDKQPLEFVRAFRNLLEANKGYDTLDKYDELLKEACEQAPAFVTTPSD